MSLTNDKFEDIDEDVKSPPDLQEKGILIADRRINFGIVGDYYLLSSKKSEFYYFALSMVESYAITK